MNFAAKLLASFSGFIGLSAAATVVAERAEAQTEAGCASCYITYYPGGGSVSGCRYTTSPWTWGSQYCFITGPNECYTGGFTSCG